MIIINEDLCCKWHFLSSIFSFFADTEGSFTEERVAEIAQACVVHLHKIAANSNSAGQLDAVRPFGHGLSILGCLYRGGKQFRTVILVAMSNKSNNVWVILFLL